MQVIRRPRSRWESTLIKVLVPMLKSYVIGSFFLVTEHNKHFSVLKTGVHSLLHWTRLSISLCNDSHSLTDLMVRKHFFLKECCFRVRVRVRVDTLRKYIPVSFIVLFLLLILAGTDSLFTCKSASDFSQKSSPELSVVTRLLSVPRFTLCCLAEWTPAFFAYCLVLTIDFILGVLELTNGNSLLLILSCSIPFSAWD